MPELPEVEHLRRSLQKILPGRRIASVRINRPGVVRCMDGAAGPAARRPRPGDLLRGAVVTGILRHGKQLAITTDAGRALCIHLGMSGQLVCLPARVVPARADHLHIEWRLAPPGAGRMIFRDPRRFGGVWAFPSLDALSESRWSRLGPDAAAITPARLAAALACTTRPLKAALLDQTLIAGLGNIYADEALFLARLHPERPAPSLTRAEAARLCRAIRRTLERAIQAGGSSLRDYVDGEGRAGGYQRRHAVYGRAGQPCLACAGPLASGLLAQRTTVWCPACQA